MTTVDPGADDRTVIGAEDLAIGLRVLADLVDAGLPVARALGSFADLAPASWHTGLPALRAAVREGRGLSSALEGSSLAIPPLVIGMVRAGEAGSGLAAAIGRAATWAEGRAATHHAIRSALAYPAVVAISGIGALTVIVSVVLPRFDSILSGLGQSLPPATRLVMSAAEVTRVLAVPVLVLAVVTAWVARRSLATPRGRRTLHRWLLAVPGIGAVREANATARFTAALSALLESGVPVRQGVLPAARAVGDAELEARAVVARDRIAAGESVSRALAEHRVVTVLASRLVAAGEESGRLASMLGFASRLEQQRADRLTRAGIRLIEPALVIGIAATVGLVAAALLQAVYAVRPA